MKPTHASAAKRAHYMARFDTVIGVALGLLLAIAALSVSAADVSVNITAYGNNDVTVGTLSSSSLVVMIAEIVPKTFNAHDFVLNAYPLYAKANPAVTSLNDVVMVGWCAKQTKELNNTLSCPYGSKYNDDTSYPYVFIQMRFPGWSSGSVALPSDVDLTSLKVLSQLAVTSFAGTSDPDTNSTNSSSGYIEIISYNGAAVYAVFGVLFGGVMIALIITCVCICRRDNAMANVNRSIIDKAINKLRSDRHKPHSTSSGLSNFADHYNINGDAGTMGPSASAVMPATTAAVSLPPREGSYTYPSPPDSRVAEREMQEIKARQTLSPDAANLQKPSL